MSVYKFPPEASPEAEYTFTSGTGIFDPDKKLICSFPPTPSPQINLRYVKRNWDKFEVTALRPGAILHLYYHAYPFSTSSSSSPSLIKEGRKEEDYDNWHLASTNGWDVGELKYCSPRPYWDLWEETCKKYDFNWRELPKDRTYTFIMHHPEIHFLDNNPHLWFVSSDNNKGLHPMLEKLSSPANITANSVNILLRNCRNSLQNYFKQGSSMPPMFGYILRHKTQREAYILHSSIWKILKTCIFKHIYQPKNKTPEERRLYIALRTYLNLNHRMLIVKCFLSPLRPDVEQIRAILDTFVNHILADYQFPTEKPPAICSAFIDKMRNDVSIDNASLHQITRAYVLEPKNLNFIYENWNEISSLPKMEH